jgi:hypothetical protein
MADRDRQLLQLPSTLRERLLIVGGLLLLIVGLAFVTWNLIDRSEQGLNDIKKVKIASISDQKVNSDVVQRNTADDQVRWECQNHPEVEQLTYRGLPVTDEGLKYLLPLKNVKVLYLSGCDVTDEGMSRLIHLPLQILSIDGTQVGDTGVTILSKIKSLISLDLGDTGVTSKGVSSLQDMPSLAIINLSGDKVADDAVQYLSHVKSLRVLDLADTDVTEKSLHFLIALPHLNQLHLHKVALTSVGTEQLSKLPKMQELDVKDTGLTDAGLKDLCSLPNIMHLDLSGTKITDAGLKYIESTPSLTGVTIESCPGVTEAGVTALINSRRRTLSVKHNRPWQELTGDELIGKFIKRNGGSRGRPPK